MRTEIIAAIAAAAGAAIAKFMDFMLGRRGQEFDADHNERELIRAERLELIGELKEQADNLRLEVDKLRAENAVLRERIGHLERLVTQLHPGADGITLG